MSHKNKSSQTKSSSWKSDHNSYSDKLTEKCSDKSSGNNSYTDKSDSDSQNYSD